VLGHVTEVAVRAVTLAEVRGIGAGELRDYFCKLRTANAENTLIAVGEGAAGQKNGGDGGIVEGKRLEKLADTSDLESFLAGCAKGLAGFHESTHGQAPARFISMG
jgi:hypothetical protein